MAKRKLGIASDDQGVLDTCGPVLEKHGEARSVAAEELASSLPLDLLQLDLGEDLDEGVELFAGCLHANPTLPVMLLGREVPGDLGAELVKLGAADLALVPVGGAVVRRKVVRLLDGGREPTVWLDTLEPLRPRTVSEQRRAYRVPVPPDAGARARLIHGPGHVAADLVDVSLESEGWPGGMLLRVRRGSPAAKTLEGARAGTKMVFQILLPTVAAPLLMAGQVVRARPGADREAFDLVLQYRPANSEAESRLNRFWMECQMRERREKASSAS